MDKKRKNSVRKYISWALLAAVVALLATMPMMAKNSNATDEAKASILSGTVTKQTLLSQLLGGGTLASQEAVEVTVPEAVKLTGYKVGNGDIVNRGDIIATVDRVTVMQAITQVQETLENLQEEIEKISDEEAPQTVKAQADATVKAVYAQKGDSVQDVMLQNGALAVLSLDDRMAVQIPCVSDLKNGDDVPLTLPDGTQITGTVETNRDGVLTVVFEDKDYAEGTEVSVEGRGKGAMYIHSRYNVLAYSGTVTSVKVEAGDSVDSGDTLIKLEDTGHTARFYQLTSQHREYEELMLELFTMYQSQTLTAPVDGVITGVDEDGAFMLSSTGSYTLSRLANAPNGDDESTYLNFVGKVMEVGIDGLVVMLNPQTLEITDYMDLSTVPLDPVFMTESVTYTAAAPIYELVEGQWVQIEQTQITAEDVLLFAGDEEGNFVWLVRVQKAATQPEQPEGPTEPSDPTVPTDPVIPDYPSYPSFPSYPNIDISGMYGDLYGDMYSGMTGMPQQESDETYSLETVTVASVTSQEEMTLSITVDELDIRSVHVGQQAQILVDALTGEKFTAVVTQVASTGESSGGNSKFTVELTLEKSGDMLPGMTASAFFTLDTMENVLCVPVEALAEQGLQTVVYTGYDAENEVLTNPVVVTTGLSDGQQVQILTGLSEGDQIWYAYYDTLEISNIPDMGGFSMF